MLIGGSKTEAGELGVSWFSATGLDLSLPDSTVLLRLAFVPRPCTGEAALTFADLPNLPIEAGRLSGQTVEVLCSIAVVPHPVQHISATICTGEVFLFCGKKLDAAGTYADTLAAANGCDSLLRLSLNVLPPIALQEFAATICAGETFLFCGKKLNTAGTYADTLAAANGCDSVLRLTLRVLAVGLYVPNVFSPNDDGVNDVFGVFGSPAVASVRSLRVWGRWGGLLFEGSGLQPEGLSGWDGRSAAGGDSCPAGVYLWQCEAVLLNGERVVRGGDVLLVR